MGPISVIMGPPPNYPKFNGFSGNQWLIRPAHKALFLGVGRLGR